ncbi:hypothetical protein HYT95_00575, partial [Candidatus Peregrinibacteria bacterium]|nr:hypothetical protein [Candidatus Peregrinibacteria bacterium]
IALGDDRYFYTCRAGERLRRFVLDHGGEVLEPALLIVNEPYGQEEKVKKWSAQLLRQIQELGPRNWDLGRYSQPLAPSPQFL